MATPAIPLSRLLLARPSSPLSTAMARGLLMPSLLPMLMLRPTLTLPTDTTATATDSTGHTDTVHTTVDISEDMEDTEPTDIPTTDKDIAARFFPWISAQILPKCVQRANLKMLNLIYQRILKPK